MPDFAPTRTVLFIISLTYLLSAAILTVLRLRGTVVPTWVIAGWMVTGVAGVVLSQLLVEGRPAVWVGLAVALVPWMAYSLYGDVKNGSWVVALTDVGAIVGIAWALGRVTKATFGE